MPIVVLLILIYIIKQFFVLLISTQDNPILNELYDALFLCYNENRGYLYGEIKDEVFGSSYQSFGNNLFCCFFSVDVFGEYAYTERFILDVFLFYFVIPTLLLTGRIFIGELKNLLKIKNRKREHYKETFGPFFIISVVMIATHIFAIKIIIDVNLDIPYLSEPQYIILYNGEIQYRSGRGSGNDTYILNGQDKDGNRHSFSLGKYEDIIRQFIDFDKLSPTFKHDNVYPTLGSSIEIHYLPHLNIIMKIKKV